jgi:hypothetical protein
MPVIVEVKFFACLKAFSNILLSQMFYCFIVKIFDVLVTVHLSLTLMILDQQLVFRVTIPDAVLIQFDLLMMSTTLLETCRGP